MSRMPNQSEAVTETLLKGDVIWVPYRKDPLWPALVHNVYKKKVSYSFFPLPSNEQDMKKNRFSCASKRTFAFVRTEPIAPNADEEFKKAFAAACDYLKQEGKVRGSAINTIAEAAEKNIRKEREIKNQKRKQVDPDSPENPEGDREIDEDDVAPPSPKRTISMSSDRQSFSSSSQQPITKEQSQIMMAVINERLETYINEIWSTTKVQELQNQNMHNELIINVRNNQFLEESDYKNVFERIVELIRSRNSSLSLISAFNITASHIIPHVLINCYSSCKNVGHQTAKAIYYRKKAPVYGLDPSINIPVTDHLEELCRLACDEGDAIRNRTPSTNV
ncbi:Protein CBG12502 [Caenorhabditis briggsae]|nr:Protein CBG12502 [Caenorhabditis briggsae]ULU12573.1 hypothetical protein L3Y34_015670 [Caenorhabditis briggsae]CAP31475.2 Protein CBG12502 [Caenorhabditis briggsae]